MIEKFPNLKQEKGLNIQKIVREQIDFVDSKFCQGVQVADLLASGLRKVLRKEFENNELIAHSLGKLMIQNLKNKPSIELITFGLDQNIKDRTLKHLINIMTEAHRPMIFKTLKTIKEI